MLSNTVSQPSQTHSMVDTLAFNCPTPNLFQTDTCVALYFLLWTWCLFNFLMLVTCIHMYLLFLIYLHYFKKLLICMYVEYAWMFVDLLKNAWCPLKMVGKHPGPELQTANCNVSVGNWTWDFWKSSQCFYKLHLSRLTVNYFNMYLKNASWHIRMLHR